jgi:hypothetical protein
MPCSENELNHSATKNNSMEKKCKATVGLFTYAMHGVDSEHLKNPTHACIIHLFSNPGFVVIPQISVEDTPWL